MHTWLDFITKLQKYTSFAFSWLPNEECKNLDAVVPDQVLAANDEAVAYQMEKDKNSGLVVILHCLNSFQHNKYVAFSLLYVWLRKTTRQMPFVSPHFIMAAILHVQCDVGSRREDKGK